VERCQWNLFLGGLERASFNIHWTYASNVRRAIELDEDDAGLQVLILLPSRDDDTVLWCAAVRRFGELICILRPRNVGKPAHRSTMSKSFHMLQHCAKGVFVIHSTFPVYFNNSICLIVSTCILLSYQ
jgi:hypothetical protein